MHFGCFAHFKKTVGLSGLLCLAFICTASAAEKSIDYANQVRPILARKCYACHGSSEQEGGLALHNRKAALTEPDSGSLAIVPGKIEQSELIARILESDADLRMPPVNHDPLTPKEISVLKQWIAEGAEFNSHWAFEPIPKIKPPQIEVTSNHPIDRFIEARLKENNVQPAPPAKREVLIRRLYFDLTGLPPSPEEVERFLADHSEGAYEKLVDQLLASPHYGERWARHWLDVVRYAETNSFERDGTKPNAWKYRDYVIKSFNDDKPYDQFLKEQLAGDVLENRNRETIIASGFYRLGIWDDEPADPKLARFDELDSILTTIGQGVLGLTINCARCHEHKIDPIPHADYYRMLSFLDELTPYGTRGDQRTNNQSDVSPPELIARYSKIDSELKQIQEQMRQIEQQGIVKMPAADQRASETRKRKKVLDEKLQQYLDKKQWQLYLPLKQRRKQLVEQRKKLPARETVLSVAKFSLNPAPTHVLQRGNPHVPGEVVSPGFPELFGVADPKLPAKDASGKLVSRRIALANWITSSNNQLTARVMANRIWQHHFARGIVRSPNNFGLLGTPPTHPDLLNWLADDFKQNGWKIKRLHRLIVTSNAYKRSSIAVQESLEKDPNNDLFWRFNLRRLSAEEVRDSVLATSGVLNRSMYGPSIYPDVSKEVLSTQSRPGEGWGKSSEQERNRRSIYIFIKRSLILPELSNFDFPDTDTTCEARFTTIQPAQALGMINGHFLNQQAEVLAARLRKEVKNDVTKQVNRGLYLVFCRKPSETEVTDGLKLIQNMQQKYQLSEEESLKLFCLYALNLNEFMFVD